MTNPIQRANELAKVSPQAADALNKAKGIAGNKVAQVQEKVGQAQQTALEKISSLPVFDDQNMQKIQKAIEAYETGVKIKKTLDGDLEKKQETLINLGLTYAEKEATVRIAKLGSKYLPKLPVKDIFARVSTAISIYKLAKDLRKKLTEANKKRIEDASKLYSYKMTPVEETPPSPPKKKIRLLPPALAKLKTKFNSTPSQG